MQTSQALTSHDYAPLTIANTTRRRRSEFGLRPEEHRIVRTAGPLAPRPVYFVDYVITTGNTLRAARTAIG
jgi:predicted amidophosphoribosyltransferase